MQYYANDTAIGPRAAVAQVLGVALDQVELGHDGTGFFLIRPEEATPDPSAVAAVVPPPDPEQPTVTDVERMQLLFIEARRQAALFLDALKSTVWVALVGGGMEPALATAAGVAFNSSKPDQHGIGVEYDDFVKNGGHPDAASALWARIDEVKEYHAWLSEPILTIFANALGQAA